MDKNLSLSPTMTEIHSAAMNWTVSFAFRATLFLWIQTLAAVHWSLPLLTYWEIPSWFPPHLDRNGELLLWEQVHNSSKTWKKENGGTSVGIVAIKTWLWALHSRLLAAITSQQPVVKLITCSVSAPLLLTSLKGLFFSWQLVSNQKNQCKGAFV